MNGLTGLNPIERRIMEIATLGEPLHISPLRHTVDDRARVPLHLIRMPGPPPTDADVCFEMAGPRSALYFDPARTRAGIVTCGGLCPGINNVIRSIYLELYHAYGVREVLGFRDGYRGLDPSRAREPLLLSSEFVDSIHRDGGTALGTSRGPVDSSIAVDELIRRGINILFTVGGDGTQRGGNALFQEARKRGHALSVVGVPKTIDNDISFVSRTFGFLTAVEEAAKVLQCAHTEARSVDHGISIVKLMGRHAGFIAAGASSASQDVNFCLIPEVPFKLDGRHGLLGALEDRIVARGHALIAVAEGAGQSLLEGVPTETDASGNPKLQDIGIFLRDRIGNYFKGRNIPVTIRYMDPSYSLRSVPADAEDSILSDLFARNAVHAAMAGKTGLVVGLMHDLFIHVPIETLAARQKRVNPQSSLWRSVLASTGQSDFS